MSYNNHFSGLPYVGIPSMPPEHSGGHSDPFSRRPSQQQLLEEYLHHAPFDMGDFHQNPMAHEDYDDSEILTRPRLTKDQVEVLESQFQAHPKPNSNVKRLLAIQTNLPLPRVSNWFQNRRAKAKQLKKQEEFELQQAMGHRDGWDKEPPEAALGHRPKASTSSVVSVKTPLVTAADRPDDLPASTTLFTSATFDSAQEASYASLQRAINAAIAGREQFTDGMGERFSMAQTDSSPMHNPSVIPSSAGAQAPISAFSDWGSSAASSVVWTPQGSDDPYDFGIAISHQSSQDQSPHEIHLENPLQSAFNQSFANFSFNQTPGGFQETMSPPQPPPTSIHEQSAFYSQEAALMSPPLQPPFYPESRRGSCSEELADSLGSFGIDPASQATGGPAQPQDPVFKRPDNRIDIAARRKKPRPAALGMAALRSRSYAGPPSMSPTSRITPTGPSPAVRRTKSSGQGLNVNYSGVRKIGAAQRSPLNHAFAESGTFNRVMTTQPPMPTQGLLTSTTLAPPTPLSPEQAANIQPDVFANEYYLADQETPSQLVHTSMGTQPNMASPPQTPLNPELMAPMQNPWMVPPPLSAPPQYATFPDYTPPYSAGPLTSSSWSDAPLTSPEFHCFPHTLHMPQPTYASPMIYGDPDIYNQGIHSSPSQGPSPHSLQAGISPQSAPQKTTEFCIQEFPKQKEAHAHAAKQLANSKPKNYIFANQTSNDF